MKAESDSRWRMIVDTVHTKGQFYKLAMQKIQDEALELTKPLQKHKQPEFRRDEPKLQKDSKNRERLAPFEKIEHMMNQRQAKYQTSAELLLEGNFDEYLKRHVVKYNPVEIVNPTADRERWLRLQDNDPNQRRVNETLNKVEDI